MVFCDLGQGNAYEVGEVSRPTQYLRMAPPSPLGGNDRGEPPLSRSEAPTSGLSMSASPSKADIAQRPGAEFTNTRPEFGRRWLTGCELTSDRPTLLKVRRDYIIEGLKRRPDSLVHVKIAIGAKTPTKDRSFFRFSKFTVGLIYFPITSRADGVIGFVFRSREARVFSEDDGLFGGIGSFRMKVTKLVNRAKGISLSA